MPNVPPALAAIQQAFQQRGYQPMAFYDNRHLQPPGLQDQFNAPPTPQLPPPTIPQMPPAYRPPTPEGPGMDFVGGGGGSYSQLRGIFSQQPPNVTEFTKRLTPDQTGQNGLDGLLRNVMTGQGGIRNAAPGGQLPGILGMLGSIKPQDGPQRQFNRSTNRWETPGRRDLGKAGFTPHRNSGTVF